MEISEGIEGGLMTMGKRRNRWPDGHNDDEDRHAQLDKECDGVVARDRTDEKQGYIRQGAS